MDLLLYYHPLASFCHKVLIALYEQGNAFRGELVEPGNPASRAPLLDIWPVGKMPVLHDVRRGVAVPESTVIIEYLDQHHPGEVALIPADPDAARETRLWDRFFDLYVQQPMQKFVGDRLRGEQERDPRGVAEAAATLDTAYAMLEAHLAGREWAVAGEFTMADCAAAPALFYAGIVRPFPRGCDHLAGYFDRLMARPSVRRTYDEARPYFHLFPYRDAMPEHLLAPEAG
nr:glutathione S-transferase family protein [Pseudoxanthomonas sp.]